MQLIPEYPGFTKLTPDAVRRFFDVCENLGMEPVWLACVISHESAGTFSPSIRNPVSGCVGLIQFCRQAAKKQGVTLDDLAAMSAEDQLDNVLEYFKPRRGNFKSLTDVYFMVQAPDAIGRPLDHVLFRKGTPEYDQNAALDKNADGVIDVQDLTTHIGNFCQHAKGELLAFNDEGELDHRAGGASEEKPEVKPEARPKRMIGPPVSPIVSGESTEEYCKANPELCQDMPGEFRIDPAVAGTKEEVPYLGEELGQGEFITSKTTLGKAVKRLDSAMTILHQDIVAQSGARGEQECMRLSGKIVDMQSKLPVVGSDEKARLEKSIKWLQIMAKGCPRPGDKPNPEVYEFFLPALQSLEEDWLEWKLNNFEDGGFLHSLDTGILRDGRDLDDVRDFEKRYNELREKYIAAEQRVTAPNVSTKPTGVLPEAKRAITHAEKTIENAAERAGKKFDKVTDSFAAAAGMTLVVVAGVFVYSHVRSRG